MDGKSILITGSSSGIGKETAFAFAREGANVVVTYNEDEKEGKEVLNECIKLGSKNPLLIQLDTRKLKNIEDNVEKITKKYGHINILINNAGVIVWKKLEDQTFEEIENQIRVNLEGTIEMTKTCLSYVKDTIINISSGAGLTGYGGLSPYCATKFGIRGFTQSLAKELPDIKVYSVNPGMTATEMTNFQGDPPEKIAKIILNTVKGEYPVESGADINIWDYIERA